MAVDASAPLLGLIPFKDLKMLLLPLQVFC